MASDGTSVEVAAAFYSFRRISDHCSFLTLRALWFGLISELLAPVSAANAYLIAQQKNPNFHSVN